MSVKHTLLQAVLLFGIGVVIAFGYNAARGKGSIKPSKNYFDTGVPVASKRAARQPAVRPSIDDATRGMTNGDPVQAASRAEGVGAPQTPEKESAAVDGTNEEPKAHKPKHDYQPITLKEVAEIFNDPETAQGLNVFVDARNDDSFEEGHIPGAIQLDPYETENYIDNVLMHTNGALKIIVYCGGGECEDSIFACRELLLAGLPYDAIYLFEGGWEEWTNADMPVAEGREE